MEGQLHEGGMISGVGSYAGMELQSPQYPIQHQQRHNHASIQELTMATMHSCDQSLRTAEYGRGKNSGSEEDEAEEGAGRGKKGSSPWQRVKWTDKMVKLLITAVSYIGDDSAVDCGRRKSAAALQKKGKWKSVSKAMAERAHRVSPQQCEDKFNDLNKRYKRLNDMLGRGTSCQVVENPALLDVIDFLTDKEKDDVRKILSSKHLFYEEMCSYHNGNRLHLPHDPALQRSLQLALGSREDHEDDRDAETDDHDEFLGDAGKRFRQTTRAAWVQQQWTESRSLHLEERKLQIQAETLELEKHRLKWERVSKKRDRELEKLRMENERMKLENERLALELKRKELGVHFT